MAAERTSTNNMDDLQGRLANCRNRYQGAYPRVLCVCSAGLLRSPTVAWVLSQSPYNCNVRIAGVRPEYALVNVDDVLLNWCDHIVAVNKFEASVMRDRLKTGEPWPSDKHLWELQLPDQFEYRDPTLVAITRSQLEEINFKHYEPED